MQTANPKPLATQEEVDENLASLTFSIGGMTCAACVHHVSNALRELPGIVEAHVSLGTETATVEFAPNAVSKPDLRDALSGAGYSVRVFADEDTSIFADGDKKIREGELKTTRYMMTFSLIVAAAIMISLGAMPKRRMAF